LSFGGKIPITPLLITADTKPTKALSPTTASHRRLRASLSVAILETNARRAVRLPRRSTPRTATRRKHGAGPGVLVL
jgi:hypothetical protein